MSHNDAGDRDALTFQGGRNSVNRYVRRGAGGREPGRAGPRGAVSGGGLRRRDGRQDLQRRRFQAMCK